MSCALHHLPPFALPIEHKKRPSSSSHNAGRKLAERHLQSCLHAGLKVTETAQRDAATWSYKLGPLGGLDLADELWMSRFLMLRVSEEAGLPVSFDPAAAGRGDSGGARCCVKYSTAATRQPCSGLAAIQRHLELLQASHLRHLHAYGKGNLQRDHMDFNISVGGCGAPVGQLATAAVVVPAKTLLLQSGHYVDRRPPSNMDPYVATMMLVATTLELPLPPVAILQQQQQLRPCGLSAAFSGLSSPMKHAAPPAAAVAMARRCCVSVGQSCRSGSSWGASRGSGSTMNSQDVLIDELDKALLGPDTPPMYGEALGNTLQSFDDNNNGIMRNLQQQEDDDDMDDDEEFDGDEYCIDEEGYDESSSSGTSPLAPSCSFL